MNTAVNDNSKYEMFVAKRGRNWVVRFHKDGALWAAGVHTDKRQALILATQDATRRMEAGYKNNV